MSVSFYRFFSSLSTVNEVFWFRAKDPKPLKVQQMPCSYGIKSPFLCLALFGNVEGGDAVGFRKGGKIENVVDKAVNRHIVK